MCLVLPTTAAEPVASAPASFDPNTVFLYVSTRARAQSGPVPVVVALHGMGNDGRGFCQSFLNAAERNGWIVLSPTFKYRNWRDPVILGEDDVALTKQLIGYLDELPTRLRMKVDSRVSIIGFSRGAQLAHRFALAYPERTRGIAAMSAGSYTLPVGMADTTAGSKVMQFPFGVADLATRFRHESDPASLARVSFWIGVGANDVNAEDVARPWDIFQGRTRVQRARSFATSLGSIGVPVNLTVFPGVGHQMSPDMIIGATTFIDKLLKAAVVPLESGDPTMEPGRTSIGIANLPPTVPSAALAVGVNAQSPAEGMFTVFNWIGILRRT